MNIWEAVFLGVLQGLTEFLPISSSGHLVISQYWLGIHEPQLFFDIMLHVGTLAAIVAVYFRELQALVVAAVQMFRDGDSYRHPVTAIRKRPERLFIVWIVVGTIPAVLVGLFLEEPIEALFGNPISVASALIATGVILQLPRLAARKPITRTTLRFMDAVRIGCAQALAIVPGISRSGSTISVGLLTRLSPDLAARYSFLLSIPAILGAAVLKLKDLGEVTVGIDVILSGTLASVVTGYLALRLLLAMLNRGRFSLFSYYCWGLGAITLLVLL